MAAAYSDDLRRKLLEAYQRGGASLPQLALRFGVSYGWARKIWDHYRATGQTKRPPAGPRGFPSRFTAAVQQHLRRLIAHQADLTLAELQQRLKQDLELSASSSRLWTVLRAMGLKLKKSRSTPPSRTLRRPRSNAPGGGKRRAGSTPRS